MAEVKTKDEAQATKSIFLSRAEVKTKGEAQATKSIFLPRASETEQQFEFVCINGKAYQVPRGKPVEVPLAVAEVLEHAQMQETELFERVHEMQQQ